MKRPNDRPLAGARARLGAIADRVARRVADRIGDVPVVSRARDLAGQIQPKRRLDGPALTKELGRVGSFREITAVIRGAVISVDAIDEHGHASVEISIDGLRMAPRGAKELVLFIEHGSVESNTMNAVLVALGEIIARGIWGPLLGKAHGGGAVDRTRVSDAATRATLDLRTLTCVRELRGGTPMTPLLDAMPNVSVNVARGVLVVDVGSIFAQPPKRP